MGRATTDELSPSATTRAQAVAAVDRAGGTIFTFALLDGTSGEHHRNLGLDARRSAGAGALRQSYFETA